MENSKRPGEVPIPGKARGIFEHDGSWIYGDPLSHLGKEYIAFHIEGYLFSFLEQEGEEKQIDFVIAPVKEGSIGRDTEVDEVGVVNPGQIFEKDYVRIIAAGKIVTVGEVKFERGKWLVEDLKCQTLYPLYEMREMSESTVEVVGDYRDGKDFEVEPPKFIICKDIPGFPRYRAEDSWTACADLATKYDSYKEALDSALFGCIIITYREAPCEILEVTPPKLSIVKNKTEEREVSKDGNETLS